MNRVDKNQYIKLPQQIENELSSGSELLYAKHTVDVLLQNALSVSHCHNSKVTHGRDYIM